MMIFSSSSFEQWRPMPVLLKPETANGGLSFRFTHLHTTVSNPHRFDRIWLDKESPSKAYYLQDKTSLVLEWSYCPPSTTYLGNFKNDEFLSASFSKPLLQLRYKNIWYSLLHTMPVILGVAVWGWCCIGKPESQKGSWKFKAGHFQATAANPCSQSVWLEIVVRDNNLKSGSAKKQGTVCHTLLHW
jgi:hypothetical protein